jgi:hypothetical protein
MPKGGVGLINVAAPLGRAAATGAPTRVTNFGRSWGRRALNQTQAQIRPAGPQAEPCAKLAIGGTSSASAPPRRPRARSSSEASVWDLGGETLAIASRRERCPPAFGAVRTGRAGLDDGVPE